MIARAKADQRLTVKIHLCYPPTIGRPVFGAQILRDGKATGHQRYVKNRAEALEWAQRVVSEDTFRRAFRQLLEQEGGR